MAGRGLHTVVFFSPAKKRPVEEVIDVETTEVKKEKLEQEEEDDGEAKNNSEEQPQVRILASFERQWQKSACVSLSNVDDTLGPPLTNSLQAFCCCQNKGGPITLINMLLF